MAINLKDNGKTNFFFDVWNMALERASKSLHHIGDSAWRTSLFTFTKMSDSLRGILLHSIHQCVYLYNGKYRFRRHPQVPLSNTCSRDQSIMILIALKEFNPVYHKHIIKNLDHRISGNLIDGATWQIDGWFWAIGKYNWWRFFCFYKFLVVRWDSAYSKHIFCWMIRSSGEEMPRLRKLMIKNTPKWNYLCRALLNDEFTPEEIKVIEDYKPRVDFIWQRDFNEEQHPLMTEEEAEYNRLDQEVLWYIMGNHG